MDFSEKLSFTGIQISSMFRDGSIVGTRQMVSRRSHGFIVKLKGETEYCFGEKKWLLTEGQILFVKKGSSYYIREVTPGFSYVINFDTVEEPREPMFRLPVTSFQDVSSIVEKMYRYWQKDRVFGALSCLYDLLDKESKALEGYLSVRDRQLLKPAEVYLIEHLTDPELTIQGLHKLCNISDAYLRRIFKRRYGVSPAGYVIKERIRLASQMLVENEEKSVAEVSVSVGYKDPLYFSRIFKKQTGESPTEYRKMHFDDLF